MANEIERRFLVDSLRLPKLPKGKLQIQGYFNNNPSSQPEVRIRLEEDKATVTFKTYFTSLTRHEYEYEIPVKDAQALLENTNKKVRKIRHKLKLDDNVWEIDFFQDENAPLIIAELELKREDQEFEKPLWTTKEITSDLRFTAIALAFKPFNKWKGGVSYDE